MVVDYAEKYSNVIDERFAQISRTDELVNQNYDFVGAKTVKVYNVSTAPMNDYKRSGSDRYGLPSELDAGTQELTMKKDRSFTFTIDKMNEDETNGALQAGEGLQRQLREVTIPEIDKHRIDVIAKGAGKTSAVKALTKANIYDAVTEATETLDENSVPYEGRFILVTPAVRSLIRQSDDFVLDTDFGQELRAKGVVGYIDGLAVVQAPSTYFPENIGFIVGHKSATTAPVKLAEYKVHTNVPGISGSLVEGRVYYDAFVLNNKKGAIYAHKTKA